MKKRIIYTLVPILLIGAFFAYFYAQAQEPYEQAEEKAIAIAKEKAAITSVSDFYIYNSRSTYYTILGENKKKQQVVVWIPKGKEKKITIKKASDGITEKQAIQKLEAEKNPEEILSVRLGMEKIGPVWELIYLDQNNQLNYYYVLFENGEWWKKIEHI
ncbi:MAG TPA: DUF5590 domain-containing protein [Chondromyces sp.]|nr:DUF5590 domain-containing protein [Chondromyces sp.]